ncbi:serine hydrolase [Modestobacter sp. VKM Ac-2986]|uniref:serine hydrolase n=1 Tax=Modestobacter sp. VKM Ac-2986 TaxID=3004140 RepID=UPI0022AACFEC|nr:serine hydrolase [Modestobacter sp. VKM Ac-2986]MCZ2828483.1 serine hydrolase [Modestobacter sp. VKM Ac-2986]
MTETSLLRAPVSRAPHAEAPTTYRHGRPGRRRRGPRLLGLVLSVVLAGWLAAHTEVVDVSALWGDPPVEAGGGTISVVALDASGDELVPSAAAGETHWTASLAKLFVVQQLLERDAAGTVTLDGDDLVRMQRAVELSDDEAMNVLWVEFGGAQLVTAAAAEFGLDDTAAPERSGQWGETTTTAADYATFLASLDAHLSPADLATLTTWMQSTTPTAADGFGQSFGLLSAQADTDGAVAAKQGWMCCLEGSRQLHSTGVLTDGRVVVLLGEFPEDTTWAQAQQALTDTAEQVVEG